MTGASNEYVEIRTTWEGPKTESAGRKGREMIDTPKPLVVSCEATGDTRTSPCGWLVLLRIAEVGGTCGCYDSLMRAQLGTASLLGLGSREKHRIGIAVGLSNMVPTMLLFLFRLEGRQKPIYALKVVEWAKRCRD